MNTHKNARLTIHGRVLLVKRVIEHGLRVEEAAQAAGVSARTAYKWLQRYREEGVSGLHNRSHAPSAAPMPLAPNAGRR
jgi:transposase